VIAEALEAVWLVASALAAWIVAGVVAVTVGLYAVVVAGWGIWRVVSAVMPRRDLSRPTGAPEPPSQASRDAEPPPTALREALSASALQTRPNRSKP
jgi:hypothetical protein